MGYYRISYRNRTRVQSGVGTGACVGHEVKAVLRPLRPRSFAATHRPKHLLLPDLHAALDAAQHGGGIELAWSALRPPSRSCRHGGYQSLAMVWTCRWQLRCIPATLKCMLLATWPCVGTSLRFRVALPHLLDLCACLSTSVNCMHVSGAACRPRSFSCCLEAPTCGILPPASSLAPWETASSTRPWIFWARPAKRRVDGREQIFMARLACVHAVVWLLSFSCIAHKPWLIEGHASMHGGPYPSSVHARKQTQRACTVATGD